MKTTIFSFLLVLVCAGCTTTGSKIAPVGMGPDSQPNASGNNAVPQSAVTITGRDRNAFVALKPQGVVTVALESNAGSRWKLARPLDPAIITLVSGNGSQLPPVSLPPGNTAPPTPEQWVFKAVGPGTTKVKLIYSRPGASLDEAVSYEFTVNAE